MPPGAVNDEAVVTFITGTSESDCSSKIIQAAIYKKEKFPAAPSPLPGLEGRPILEMHRPNNQHRARTRRNVARLRAK